MGFKITHAALPSRLLVWPLCIQAHGGSDRMSGTSDTAGWPQCPYLPPRPCLIYSCIVSLTFTVVSRWMFIWHLLSCFNIAPGDFFFLLPVFWLYLYSIHFHACECLLISISVCVNVITSLNNEAIVCEGGISVSLAVRSDFRLFMHPDTW